MFGRIAVKKELDLLRISALEVITEEILFAEEAKDYYKALGAVRMARELLLISPAEAKQFEDEIAAKNSAE